MKIIIWLEYFNVIVKKWFLNEYEIFWNIFYRAQDQYDSYPVSIRQYITIFWLYIMCNDDFNNHILSQILRIALSII